MGRGGDVLVIMRSGRWRSVPAFLIGSTGRETGLMGACRFIQFVFSYSQCQVRAHGGMTSIWDEVDGV